MPMLRPWMVWVLRIAGTYNILAGVGLLVGYHEVYQMFNAPKPALVLPMQMLGVMMALFGVGFHLAASYPAQNRHLLLLGFWSKLLGFVLASYTVVRGQLGPEFFVVVIFADLVYVPTLWLILRHLRGGTRAMTVPEDYTTFASSPRMASNTLSQSPRVG